MDQNELPLELCHLGVPLGASKTIFETMVRSVQTVHLFCVKIILSLNGPKRASSWPTSCRSTIGCVQKRFLRLWYVWHEQCTYLAPIPTLCPNRRNEIPHDPRHLGVPLRASKTISLPMVRSVQTVHLSYIKICTISKQTEMSFNLSLIT